MQDILDITLLHNKKEVKIHVAMISFVKNHIPNRAEILEPLI